ncbi:MAG: hypothetical protein AAF579_07740 [Cyanobacteria bacterium P01_C01_bin.118]
MKHISHGTAVLSMVSLLMVGSGSIAPKAQANNAHSGCYIEDDNGEIYDLGILCPVFEDDLSAEPVLQTGDIQVTLRWDTNDDLDLIVVDPAGSIIDFGSPTAPSGGQLDVDANGFCQTQSFTPVENIFWPTGEAPDGEYLAYVTLAIPCSLEELANSDAAAATAAYKTLQVPYTLTILVQGVTTTYTGMSQPDELGVTYPFRVGSPTATPAETAPAEISDPPEKSEDALELPNFGLPEL